VRRYGPWEVMSGMSRESGKKVEHIIPLGLPSWACHYIRQERTWWLPPSEKRGFRFGPYTCARHGIALGDELERCKGREAGPCWYEQKKRVLGAHKIGMESRGPSSLPFSLLGFVSWLRWTAGPLL